MPRFVDSKSAAMAADPATLEKALADAFAQLDARRVAGWSRLADVQLGRNVVLAAQRARVAARGDGDAETLRALDVDAQQNRATAARFARQSVRAATPLPTVAADEWVLYGHVQKDDGTAAPQLTVALYLDGKRLKLESDTATRDDGAYLVRVHDRDLPRAERTATAAAVVDTHAEATAAAPGLVLTVRVLDDKGAVQAEPPEKLVPLAGAADYLEITLPPGGARAR